VAIVKIQDVNGEENKGGEKKRFLLSSVRHDLMLPQPID